MSQTPYNRRQLINIVGDLVDTVFDAGLKIKRATKYISPTLTIKVTFRGKHDKRDYQRTALVTIGRPNYAEQEFIKDCKKAGVKFPVKKIQLQFEKVRKNEHKNRTIRKSSRRRKNK